ncbi:MAG: zinc ABC transporter solute-binding protein, partial [Chloroflexi bacterium]|nr:zinc ABC transporter solute-binding protein [Chloroflexota bacterium]
MKNITRRISTTVAIASILLFTINNCRPTTPATEEHSDALPPLSAVTLSAGEKLQIVATTSIVADVVHNVGGDLIDLTALMPVGTDPHAFEPTPQDVAAVADAHVVF